MSMWRSLLLAVILFTGLFASFYFLRAHPGGYRTGVWSNVAWQRMASPGPLSNAHSFLEHDCAACHTSVKGVQPASCIACHANNTALLQRQPTAFHASVSSCSECHLEHRGPGQKIASMDHSALSRIGLRQLKDNPDPGTEDRLTSDYLSRWIHQQDSSPASEPANASLSPQERILNCAVCHGTKDRHAGLFGQDCAQCHATSKWTIPQFRHPPPTSLDCSQCHQAPPSHYMMHFKMVSMTAAGVENAQVNQCFLCHQTTSWNDIKGVGYYKHH